MDKPFPVFVDFDHVFCFSCKLRIEGPFNSSGFARRYGAWRGQCTGQHGCNMITFFDIKPAKEESNG